MLSTARRFTTRLGVAALAPNMRRWLSTVPANNLSHVKGGQDPPLLTKTFWQLFDEQARTYGNREFMVVRDENLRLSWNEFSYRASAMATGLLKLGYKKGDRFGIWMPNHNEWTILQLATAQIGVILVNFNPSYRAHELKHAINLVGCKGVLLTPEHRQDKYLNILQSLAPELEHCDPRDLRADQIPTLKHVVSRGKPGVKGVLTVEDIMVTPDYEALNKATAALHHDDVINIQFTSGTTGLPKAAGLTHTTIVNNGYLIGHTMKVQDTDKVCIPVPLYHCFGTVLGNMAFISKGASLVFPAPTFNAEATLDAVVDERCTALHGVPTMMISVLDHPKFKGSDVSCLRTGIMAGASCPVELMKRVMTDLHMPDVVIVYGMTETGPASFMTKTDDTVEQRCETVGTVMPHTECKVVDATGQVVPVNTPGELLTKGYLVMRGYWNQPEKTRDAFDSQGFIKTGDQVVMDDKGYVRIVGRLKDIIIRGGENISPREIEEFLYTHPDISDVQIVAAPDKKYGEQVAAFIVPKAGAKESPGLTQEGLAKFCEGKIARFKVPHYVWVVDQFPMTVTGKIQKNKLRDMAKEMSSQPTVAVN